jgi:ubiquinone/menaquinone biosynthesis C-methylase UbiE
MIHKDHVNLIKNASIMPKSIWADFGSGWGAFTLALRDIAGENIEIFSIDTDKSSLSEQKVNFENQFPNSNIHFINSDFSNKLELPKLDGILMANSLHYVKDQISFLKHIKSYLKPDGKFLIVEYNSDSANTWVPYPVSFVKLKLLCKQARLSTPHLLSETPSTFLDEIYSAEVELSQ